MTTTYIYQLTVLIKSLTSHFRPI